MIKDQDIVVLAVLMEDRLAVIDMLRGGRIRERRFAERKLQEMMA